MNLTKRRWFGDRVDAQQIKGLDPMHLIMPGMMPQRTDNEAFIQESIDAEPLEKWLAAKNAKNPEHHYTYFHAMLAAAGRTIAMRPRMNTFIKGCRYYRRNDISFSFVAKRAFSEGASEGVAMIDYDPTLKASSIDQMHGKVCDFVYALREKKELDHSTDMMGVFTWMPKRLTFLAMRLLAWLDDRGIMPKALSLADPYASTVFISNVGSLGLGAGYHHLSNWGTCSIFILMGQKHPAPVTDENGNTVLKSVIDIGLTLDERIADGYYYAKTVRVLKYLLEHPDLLDTPCDEEVSIDA